VGVLLVIALLLLIRNVFGWVFVAAVATICIWGGLKAAKDVAQLMVIFVGVQLALSVFSRSDYLFTATARTGMGAAPSDVAQMADALFLPYWFWGIACGGFSIFVLFHGLRRFINATQ
jgi:hypothetical protein